MAEVGTIGLDTAKRVFQVHGVDTAGAIVFRRQLRRAEMVRSSPSCPPCLAADLAPRKIRVNVVAPGATKTPIWKRGARANATAEESAKVSDFFSSTVPLARWGEPEDVARAVLFLASDDSSYINAVELMVDGGLTGAPSEPPFFAADRRE